MTLTLYHAPISRSTRILNLLVELDALDKVDIRRVSIPRQDGTGGTDPDNPHPEGKVPYLVHDGTGIWESGAVILYLTEMLGTPPFAPQHGDAKRGSYLSWLFYYGDVMEPVVHHKLTGAEHPALQATFRGFPEMTARLETALEHGPYLLGDDYTAADLLVASPFTWFSDLTPESGPVRAWIKRCMERPGYLRAAEMETTAMAAS